MQVIVPLPLRPLGAPIYCGPATADWNPGPIPQNALLAGNQPQAQGQVIPGPVPAQAQVVPGVVPGQSQRQAQVQVAPGVVLHQT